MLGVFAAWMSVLGVVRAETVVWSDNFDDSNATNRWYTDYGLWQIGSPTIGPETNSAGCRAHSCPNCAAIGLTADYPYDADSRLIRIQPFPVPGADQFPRLRFWHWFSTQDGPDYGQVQIRVGTNPWQAASPKYTGLSGDWTYASLDLSLFAGQTVQLGFLFVSDGPGYEGPGWYVDDVALVTGTPVFNNPEGFEGGIGDWYAENGTWQVGTPTKSDGPLTNALGFRAHSGSNCAVTVLNADYPYSVSSRLVSPGFAVPSANQYPRLRFWHWFSTQDGPDYGQVQIRVGTNPWQALSGQYTGLCGGWTEPSLDLTAYAGQTVQLGFLFVSDGPGYEGPGWYVDDVALVTGTPVFNNPEGFEGGIGDWYAENGTWQVGTPTKSDGPLTNALGFQAHSGSNCAVTVLNADYPYSVNSRLISPAFVVPPASSGPYLRFWQWYSTQSGPDYGEVQIRVGTNAWQALSVHYTGASGPWWEPLLDLTPYAGESVQLGLHFVSDGPGYEGAGWYVDDIQVYPNVAQTGSLQVFIGPPGAVSDGAQWQVDGGAWQTSGATVTNLSVDSHTVSFSAVSGWTAPTNQSVSIGANSTTTATGTYVAETGCVDVVIGPPGAVSAEAQWQAEGGSWQTNGATLCGLPVGSHTLGFSAVSGWITPANQTFSVSANSTTTVAVSYLPQTGSLTVTLAPAGAVSAGAAWQVDGGGWQSSGATVYGLQVGIHAVCFSNVPGWTAPACESVTISWNQTTTTNATYVSVPETGSLQVNITPAGAVSAGAQWQVDTGPWESSGATAYGLLVGPHTVSFSTVANWTKPTNQTVTIIWNQTTTANGTYVPAVPVHPADAMGDFRITIDEVTAYGAAWQQGACWPTGPAPCGSGQFDIPIDYVTRAGYLWRNGECYSYDASNSPPLCWVSTPCPGAGVVADREGKKAPPVSRAASPKEAGDSVVTRTVSRGVVSLQISPDPETSVYAVEESLPAGLTPYAISDGGSWDSVNQKIKWGLFFDNTTRVLSYKLGGVAGIHPLSGVGSFDGQSIAASGMMSLELEPSLRLVPGGAAPSSGGFQLTFGTESGRTYYIEYADSLSSNSWQRAGGPLTGTGQAVTWKDGGAMAGGRPGLAGARYYRVRLAP